MAEGDSGTADLEFTVTLSPASDAAATVAWATSKESGDTATPGTDYTAASGTLSFAAGETSKTVSVKVSGDEVDEDDETLTLTLSGAAGGASIGTAAATGTIADDDERGLAFAPGLGHRHRGGRGGAHGEPTRWRWPAGPPAAVTVEARTRRARRAGTRPRRGRTLRRRGRGDGEPAGHADASRRRTGRTARR